jgi:hypothetical protein
MLCLRFDAQCRRDGQVSGFFVFTGTGLLFRQRILKRGRVFFHEITFNECSDKKVHREQRAIDVTVPLIQNLG